MPYGTVNTDILQGTLGGIISPDSSVFRNRIINGAMVIDQRNAGASSTFATTGAYTTVDRFQAFNNTSGTATNQQVVDAPAGFYNSLKVTITSSVTPAAGELFQLQQVIEGHNISDFAFGTANAKTITLSFWVKSSLTGQFGGAIQDAAAGYGYPFSYTISSANTWEQKSITIPGATSGTWGTTTSAGLRLYFNLGMGSNYLGTAGAWASAGVRGVTGDTKLVSTNGATWNITGVQLEVGSTASSFEYRSYGQELALCQRYYYNIFGTASDFQAFGCGVWLSSTVGKVLIDLPVPLRVVPTLEAASLRLFDAAASTTRSATGFSIAYTVTATNKAFIDVSVGSSSASAGDACLAVLNTSTSARVGFSAEL
jgi:hypothetical protein